jgi:hypothetical protein
VRAGALLLGAVALMGGRSGASQVVDSTGAVGSKVVDSTATVKRWHFWVRPVASFLVPGTGQILAHQDRAAIYIGTEAYGLTRFIQLTVSSHRDATRFRDLAFQVARAAFAPARRDTVFEYFETMQRFMESGQFDRDPGPDFAPEVDTTTYNGSVWMTARRTYWQDPNTPPSATSLQYARALQFYETHAVGPGYLWSWRNSEQELSVFRETIRKSDSAFRKAQDQLGILLANHLVSAVDAFISSRLSSAARRPTTLRTALRSTDAVISISVAF